MEPEPEEEDDNSSDADGSTVAVDSVVCKDQNMENNLFNIHLSLYIC